MKKFLPSVQLTSILFDVDDVIASCLQGHTKSVCSVSFSPDKRLLLSSSSDATVRLWNIATRSNVVVYRQILPVWQVRAFRLFAAYL